MIKNLVKHGNSWAVIIDRPIMRVKSPTTVVVPVYVI
jgi:hypothetical protein